MNAHRNHATYWAFVLHRVSGLALALFVPVHLYVLSRAVDAEAFDAFLRWTEDPWVKAAETALVFALAAHMTGGLRLLALEFLPWRDRQKTFAAIAAGAAVAVALLFVLRVV